MRHLCLLPLACITLQAAETTVSTADALHTALQSARPGDTLTLAPGEWQDVIIRCKAQGTAQAPITLRAASPGQTIFTGKSALRLGGSHIIVEGLWFRDPDPEVGDTLEFRLDSKNPASHCRITQCAITMAPGATARDAKESRWIGIYGSHNRLDHCLIQGKVTKGATVVVWLSPGQEAQHQLDHNHFGPRERLGKNGGETLRIGDSATSMLTAACIIEDNLFYRCNGEAECISNKSCGNHYRRNTFLEVSGTLTLRHGNQCTVEHNHFLGNHAKGTGGVRIIGEDHLVRANHFQNLTGDDARCAIVLMQGVVDSKPNEYFQVKRAKVHANTVLDCENPILIGLKDGRGSLPPLDTEFLENRILATTSTLIEARCDTAGLTWKDNLFFGKALGIPEEPGISWQQPKMPNIPPLQPGQTGPAWWKEKAPAP